MDKIQEEKNKESERIITWLEDHYSTFNEEFGKVVNDVSWIKKIQWAIFISSLGIFFTLLTHAFLTFLKLG